MKKSDRVIIWSKFIDVTGKNREEIEYVKEDDLTEDRFDNDAYERYQFENEDEHEHEIEDGYVEKVVVTDFGIMKLRPYNNLSKAFNMWEGNASFNIGEKTATIINKTRGVEGLKIYSPYRFMIAVGNAFSFQNVRQDIEKSLYVTPKKSNGEHNA